MSVFSKKFWMLKKGLNEEEAELEIRKRRPVCPEYYMVKHGVSLEQAKVMVNEFQTKSSKISASRPKEEMRKTSKRCKEYWTNLGLSDEQAQRMVAETQSTFSLQKCIDKHGLDIGTKIFNERQVKWKEALNNKSDLEMGRINRAKAALSIRHGYDVEEEKLRLITCLTARNLPVFNTENEIIKFLSEKYDQNPFDRLLTSKKFIRKYVKNYFWIFVAKPKSLHKWIERHLQFVNLEEQFFRNNGETGYYNMYTKAGSLLRSSNEIYFYHLCTEYGLLENVDFEIERYYDGCNLRSDFYFLHSNKHIELCGSKDEDYIQRMMYKEDTFGSILLHNKTEYNNVIREYYENFCSKDN